MTQETDHQSLHQALLDLPHEQHGPTVVQVKKLSKLIDGDLPLQSFLEQLLPSLCELFSAKAAVAWLRAQGAPGAIFGVRYRMDDLLSTAAEQKKHERLVQLAWSQKQAMLAEPTPTGRRAASERNDKSEKSSEKSTEKQGNNPTGHQLLFGPVLHLGEPIALLEVVLHESPAALTPAQRKLYLRGVQLIAERVYIGLRKADVDARRDLATGFAAARTNRQPSRIAATTDPHHDRSAIAAVPRLVLRVA